MAGEFDFFKYAVGGAASRPDSFTGLDPAYAERVAAMIRAAEAELGPRALTITSAYRSPELQAELYEAAVKKYGSEAAARKWVAPPGKSKHNHGLAVDFADASGAMLRDANSREARWIAENAARFGLSVPMSWEPWQVELAGSRGAGQTGAATAPTNQPPGNALAGYAQEPEPQNVLARPHLQLIDTRLDPAALMNRPRRNALAIG